MFLSSCVGIAYRYRFDGGDIKEIAIITEASNLTEASEIIIDGELFGEFFDGLKELNYKSYVGDIRGKEERTIRIILTDDSEYVFEAYFIIKNDKKAKFSCDVVEYIALLDKYS
jgi:hypothetical protein